MVLNMVAITTVIRKNILMSLSLFMILVSAQGFAAQDVSLADTGIKVPLSSRCETLEDKKGAINVYSIISGNHDRQFSPVKSDIPNFGFTKSVYWIRFHVSNESAQSITRMLEIAFPLLDRVQLFIFSENGENSDLIRNEISGRDYPFKNRSIEHRNFVYSFTAPPGQKLTFIIRIQTDDGMIFPLYLWEPAHFYQRVQLEHILFGIYYGIILVMILFNLFIYLSIRDRYYLIYILYITSFGFFQLAMNGFAVQYLWPESPWFGIRANPFFIGLSALFGTYFSIRFLEMPVNAPRISRVMHALMGAGILLSLSSLFADYSIVILAGQILPLLMIFLGIPAAIFAIRNGNRSAGIYLLAWMVFFIGVVLSTFRVMGLLPHNFFTEFGLQIGSALEMILLSLALADRINIMKREKEVAQQEVIRSQQQIVDNLNRSKEEIEEAHRMLSISEEKYRLLIEGSSDIIFTLDEDLRFLTANNAITRELRLNPVTIQGMSFLEFVYSDEREQHVSLMLVKEKINELFQFKKPVNFKTSFISPIITEPKEMHVYLEFINISGKNEILGKASTVLDDSLLRYFVSERQKFSIGNYLITADEITHRITRNIKKYLDADSIKLMQIALREIIINAIEHGNLGVTFKDKTESMMNDSYFELIRTRQIEAESLDKKVHIDYSINSDRVIYVVADEGNGFNHEKILTGIESEVNENMLAHGRGITMARSAFDEITYNRKGNHVMLTRYFNERKTAK